MANNELTHWGVKGQKWGVRRYRNTDGSLTQAGKSRYSEKNDQHDDYRKAHSKKSVKTMSDKELREVNNRLQMERQYKDLSKKAKVGKNAVSSFVKGAATLTAVAGAYKIYKGYADSAIDKLGDVIVNSINLDF